MGVQCTRNGNAGASAIPVHIEHASPELHCGRWLPSSATTDYSDSFSAVDYTISQDASIRIGVGQNALSRISDCRARTKFTPPAGTPYIDPTGVINAASFAPFTTGLAPANLVSIYGANFATSATVTAGGVVFPKQLANVRV